MSDFVARCSKATGYFDGVEVDPLLEDSALVTIASWNRLDTLGEIIRALNAVGKVRSYHESLTSFAARAHTEMKLVVEPDPEHD